jgi:hypothetical protein
VQVIRWLCARECLCVKALLALCIDLVLEGGSGAQCVDLLSSAELDSMSWCTEIVECKRLMNNKEDEAVSGCSPTLG